MTEKTSIFKGSLKPNKRLGRVVLWEVSLVIAIVVGVVLWGRAMSTLAPMAEQALGPLQMAASSQFEQALLMGQAEPALMKIRNMSILYSAIGLIYLLFVWTFLKMRAYLQVRGQKFRWASYGKFLGIAIIWHAFLLLTVYGLQKLIMATLYYKTAESQAAAYGIVVLSLLYVLIMVHLTVTLFSIFVKKQECKKTVKTYYETVIKGHKKMWKPFGVVGLMFIGLNIGLFIAKILQAAPLILTVQTIIVLYFIVWVKIYYSDVIDSLDKEKEKKVMRKKATKKKIVKKKIVKKRVKKVTKKRLVKNKVKKT